MGDDTIIDTIRKRFRRSAYGIGFSGDEGTKIPILERIQSVQSVVKTKGIAGIMSDISKGERPIMSKLAPGLVKSKPTEPVSPQTLPVFRRLPAYRSDYVSPSPGIPEETRKGETKIGSIGN